MGENNGFVFYRSFREDFRALRTPEEKLEYVTAIMDYGIVGAYDEPSYPINILVSQCTASIDAAESRYNIAKESGSRGGRKEKELNMHEINSLYAQLHNWEAVAKELHVSLRKLHDFRSKHKSADKCNVQKVQKCKNLNTNKNDNSFEGDADKDPHSPKEETNAQSMVNFSAPLRGPERSAEEAPPPDGCEWISPPFESDGRIMREYHAIGGTATGIERVG